MPTQHFEFRKILEILNLHKVDYIVVGGVCAVAHGAPLTTFDIDILYRQTPENLDHILEALSALDACHREPGDRHLSPQRSVLERGGPALFKTTHGSLDLLGTVAVERTFEDLLPNTIELSLESGFNVHILDLETLIDVKEKTGRPKDLAVLPLLRQTLAERNRTDPEV